MFIIIFLEKVFSFLSQDEVEKMKQEEGIVFVNYIIKFLIRTINKYYCAFSEKKIATLTRDELKSWAQLDENEGLEDLEETLEDQDNRRPK